MSSAGPSGLSLNQSITAAWGSQAQPSASAAVKKRVRKTVGLNDTSTPPETDGERTPGDRTPVERERSERKKRIKRDPTNENKYAPPEARLSQLGGLDKQIKQLLEIVALPLLHPEIYSFTGITRPHGVLLHGVPGGGKTQLVHCLAGQLQLPFITISAPSIVSGMSGESERALREHFDEAKRHAPCILFLDEVDAITPKRETAQREMERRIVAQLLTCMDDLAGRDKPVIMLGATNRPDSIDPALRRAGRFDHEIEMGVPTVEGREQILRVLLQNLKLAPEVDIRWLAKSTPGYVGADLTSLTTEAGVVAVKRIFETMAGPVSQEVAMENMALDDGPMAQLPSGVMATPIAQFLANHPGPLGAEQLGQLVLLPSDFDAALKVVQPSAKREGFATVPDVTWADIGALGNVRDELHMAVVQPIRHPELFSVVGIDAPSGVLLWGPPGCGKTLLAKAVANESRANFISVKGPELLNKYVGESERAVRQVFARARASAPCVIFFDELDALVPRRDDSMSESSARVVNTLLTELDGLDARKAVYVIGATNRPDMIDPAMVRPGRLDKLLYVDLPSPAERLEVLRTHTKRTPIAEEDWAAIAALVNSDACDGFSGADIAALVREAASLALRSALEAIGAFENDADRGSRGGEVTMAPQVNVSAEHFAKAAQKTQPSVSREQRHKYERMRDKYAGVPTKGRRTRAERDAEEKAAWDAARVATGEEKADEPVPMPGLS
ncbi:helicase [Trichosporon asahii var. asahii CBS 8904]|uniref:Helicase n=1 Tax=Trichosporon asahii var. asahii (strain CBS 8904) TaxID=1220162 RepID=K1VQ88_TRIAC|nr:helicase [Trichosporon asahii var. asahii CBS 8904]